MSFSVTMLRSLAAVLLLLAVVAEGIVVFNDSAVVDESDFMNPFPTPVTGLCRDLCHIYASVEYDHRYIAANLLIQTQKGFVSVLSVADQIDDKTKRLTPLENMPNLVITNTNANYKSGHIVIYVVNHNADYFDTAEVYEASGLDRKPSYARAITIISSGPFTLTESNYMSMGVIAKLAGFDTLDGQTCPAVYSLSWLPFPGFQMTINAPIVSLLYDLKQFPYPAGELKTTLSFADTHRMEQNGFFASAGWHGCNGRLAYQSSFYNETIGMEQKLLDSYTSDQDISINVQTNTNEANAVIVRDSNDKEVARYFDAKDSQSVQQFRDYKLSFSWKAQQGTHYLVRYNSTAKPVY